MAQAVELYKPIKAAEVNTKLKEEWYDWEVIAKEMHNSELETAFSSQLSIIQPCYLQNDRSEIEQLFEVYLENQHSKIVWWYKNGVNKKTYFGIKYEDENRYVHTFYPDYIVQFINGRTGIFDTKDGITAKDATYKAEALQKYIETENNEGKNLFGGIIIIDNNQFRLNEADIYRYNPKELGDDWLFLSTVF